VLATRRSLKPLGKSLAKLGHLRAYDHGTVGLRWIALEVLAMVVACGPEMLVGDDLGNDGISEQTLRTQFIDEGCCRRRLRIVMGKDGGPILRPMSLPWRFRVVGSWTPKNTSSISL